MTGVEIKHPDEIAKDQIEKLLKWAKGYRGDYQTVILQKLRSLAKILGVEEK